MGWVVCSKDIQGTGRSKSQIQACTWHVPMSLSEVGSGTREETEA